MLNFPQNSDFQSLTNIFSPIQGSPLLNLAFGGGLPSSPVQSKSSVIPKKTTTSNSALSLLQLLLAGTGSAAGTSIFSSSFPNSKTKLLDSFSSNSILPKMAKSQDKDTIIPGDKQHAAEALKSIRQADKEYTGEIDDQYLQDFITKHPNDNLRHAAEILLGQNGNEPSNLTLKALYGTGKSVSLADVDAFVGG